jgi:hypothetical protein
MARVSKGTGPDQALADAVAALVAGHGVQKVVAAVAAACGWRAHHLRSIHASRRLADAWEKAGTTLAWVSEITLRDLEGPRAGGAS